MRPVKVVFSRIGFMEEKLKQISMNKPRCPYCHGDISGIEDKKGCEQCMAWHHKECWVEYGKCATCFAKDKRPDVYENANALGNPVSDDLFGDVNIEESIGVSERREEAKSNESLIRKIRLEECENMEAEIVFHQARRDYGTAWKLLKRLYKINSNQALTIHISIVKDTGELNLVALKIALWIVAGISGVFSVGLGVFIILLLWWFIAFFIWQYYGYRIHPHKREDFLSPFALF